LDELRKVQTEDFAALLRAMSGLPVTVRLLDPPLHEFLPSVDELEIKKATVGLTAEESKLMDAAHSWAEVNPMLGTRGVRLGVIKPGLYAMQVRALLAAADIVAGEGYSPIVEVMIPLTVTKEELALARSWVEQEILDHGKQLKAAPKSGAKKTNRANKPWGRCSPFPRWSRRGTSGKMDRIRRLCGQIQETQQIRDQNLIPTP
jgi:pyruvate,orthophosphate dikinase